MATCPKGHTSVATDYCDECGAPIALSSTSEPAATPTAPPAGARSAGSTGSVGSAGSAGTLDPTVTGEPCPECRTPRDGRFCEVCGHDFLAAPDAAASSPVTPAPVSPSTVAPATPVAPTGTGGVQWRVVVTADKAYYDRMRAQAEPDAEPVPFPQFCPERRFVLSGEQVLVGRRSRSRGIEPGVDLTGPPEDAGVSHAHALFVATPAGWSIVDLDSANGTYVNDTDEQIPANEPVPLAAGDRVHVGAWTTLTVDSA